MYGFARVLAVLLAIGLVIGIGATVYNAGVTTGLTQVAQEATASGAAAPVIVAPGPFWHGAWGWGGGWGWGGPGFFGIFFWILGIFLVFALIRAAFGWGRWDRRGPGGPRGWGGWDDRHGRLDELHRELHRRETRDGSPDSAAP